MHMLFAFGMNLDPSCMYEGCHEIGPAVLRDWTLEFRIYANIKPAPGKQVQGALWHLDSEALRYIDLREGYEKGRKNNLYDRITVKVDNGDEQVDAFVYVMALASGRPLGVSPEYLSMLLNGYKHFGLDEAPLWETVRQSCSSTAHFHALWKTTLRYMREEAETNA